MNETFPFFREIENDCSIGHIVNDYLKTEEMPLKIPERTLFHYTSLDVMNEMCKENGDFLATHFMSLNDTHEFFLGVQLALRELESCPSLPEDILNDLPQFQTDARKRIVSLLNSGDISPWIVSFSKEPDSLSQWVSYTDRIQGGVAIGFDSSIIQKAIREEEDGPLFSTSKLSFHMTRCRYTNDNNAKDWLKTVFNNVTTSVPFKSASLNERKQRILATIVICAAAIKNKSFSPERESRLVVLCSQEELRKRYKFVGGKPRIETRLFGNKYKMAQAISSVVISPQGNRAKMISTVNLLRQKLGRDIPIWLSMSSYNGQ